MIFTKTFENGFRLAVDENPSAYSVSTGICVGVGSCLEDKSNNGFSHFVEHMLFKGTKSRTAFDISDGVDRIGGKINAFTSKDMTCYFARTSANHAEAALEILGDMFFNSLFDEEEIEREKKVVLEEISMGEDQPDEVCQDLLAEAVFGSHPLGQAIIGKSERINSLTRAELTDFVSKFYRSGDIVLSMAGNIKFNDAVKLAEKYFVKNLSATGSSAPLARAKHRSVFLSRVKDVEQTHICAAFPSFSADDEMLPAAAVFTNVFGGGMSSRLFQTIREKHGMAYSVFAYNSSYVSNGYFEIYAGTNPKNLSKLLGLVKEEILKVLSGGITESELTRGKEQLKGGLLLSQESSVTVMSAMARNLLKLGKIVTVEEQIDRINNITMADINKVINTIFTPQNACMAVVGKEKATKKILEGFKWTN